MVEPTPAAGLRSTTNACALLAWSLLPIAVCLSAFLFGAHQLYRLQPTRVELANSSQNSIDFVIVQEQLARIAAPAPASVAFFGDSSCFMGVDPPALGALLRRSVTAYCTLAYIGPAGYASSIKRLLGGPARPEVIVLMIHPTQFKREPSWESWPAYVENWTPRPTPTQKFPVAGLDYLRLDVLGRSLFKPLPGAYGLFYGGEAQFIDMIGERGGSAVDPNLGLTQRSLAQVADLVRGSTPQRGPEISYERNDQFRASLAKLRAVLREFDPERVLLVISPVPDYNLGGSGAAQREAAGREIATLLGLPERSLLGTPAALPLAYFSSQTHTTRWGKQYFTRIMGEVLAPRLPPA